MWEEREWIESHLDVDEIRNQVTDVNKLLTGGLNHPCQRPTGRRLSAFVQISALFKKGWKALFFQLKPQEMHCKQEDSATFKILLYGLYSNTSVM